MNIVKVTRYVHDEEDELSSLWPYDAPQQDVYHYALYETQIDLEVDLDSGKNRIVAVNGRLITDPGDFR
jgi:hypothetical protein